MEEAVDGVKYKQLVEYVWPVDVPPRDELLDTPPLFLTHRIIEMAQGLLTECAGLPH
jgi:hypothetical protein